MTTYDISEQTAVETLPATMLEAFQNLYRGRSVVSPITGEIVDITDPSIPCEEKVDAVSWMLHSFDSEEDYIQQRISRWKEKLEKVRLLKEKTRELFLEQMKAEGKTKVKSEERTFFVVTKNRLKYKDEEIPPQCLLYEPKLQLTYAQIQSLAQIVADPSLPLISKTKLHPHYVEELKQQGLIVEEPTQHLSSR